MRKFRAPSSSLASTAFVPSNTRAQATKPRKPHATSRHVRAHKLDKAKEAAKRVQKTKQQVEPTTAYVGNFGPEVDENALIAHFSRFGNIISARIHCCGGVAMTVKPPPASYHQHMRVRQYGMVTFETKLAQYKACKKGGTLGEHQLVVSSLISDLPEFQEKIVKRLDDYKSRLEAPDERRARESVFKSLKRLEPTILLDPKQQENGRKLRRNRHQIMGLTFREGIM